MGNAKVSFKGTKMLLEVDLSVKGAPSKSGKSDIIGTTNGNIMVASPDGKTYMVGCNVYQPK